MYVISYIDNDNQSYNCIQKTIQERARRDLQCQLLKLAIHNPVCPKGRTVQVDCTVFPERVFDKFAQFSGTVQAIE